MKMAVIPMLFLMAGCASQRQSSGLRWSSPGGAYIAHIHENSVDAGNQSISLVVESKADHSVIFSLPVERHVEVVWSPRGDQVAIVDVFASNENRVEIFRLPTGQRLLTISRDDWNDRNSGLPSPTNYSHVYFSDLVWTEPQRVKLNVEMYDRLSSTVPEEYESSCQFEVVNNQ
jgi:hypothetical protein